MVRRTINESVLTLHSVSVPNDEDKMIEGRDKMIEDYLNEDRLVNRKFGGTPKYSNPVIHQEFWKLKHEQRPAIT